MFVRSRPIQYFKNIYFDGVSKTITAPALASQEMTNTEVDPVQFVRVPVIQKKGISSPDSDIFLQKELDLVWNYLHKKFRRRKEDELISRC